MKPEDIAVALEKWLPQAKLPQEETITQSVEEAVDKNVFDKDALLGKLMNDAELMGTIIDVFLEDIPKQIDILKNALDAEDADAARRLAHSIKGAAGNVCAYALQESARQAEKAGKAGDLKTAGEHTSNILLEFDKIKSLVARQ